MEQTNNPSETPIQPNVLTVGSRVYRISFSSIVEVIVIERVTKTQAIAKNGACKFDINISKTGSIRRIGERNTYSRQSFRLETEELKHQLWHQNAVQACNDTQFSKLPIEDLREILSIIQRSKK